MLACLLVVLLAPLCWAAPDLTRPAALVTGISGLIGSHVARELVRRDTFVVYGVVRPRTDLTNLVGIMDSLQFETCDISDSVCTGWVIGKVKPDYVFHFAGQAINSLSTTMPELTLQSNVQGTFHVLNAIRKHGLSASTKVLLAGSSTEYGSTSDDWDGRPLAEDAPLRPVSAYGVSKVSAEMLAIEHFTTYGIETVIARFFIHVGPGGTDFLAINQFAKHIALAELGLRPAVVSHGNLESWRDITDVADSAPAVVDLLLKGKGGEAYNVGSGTALKIFDLLKSAVEQSTTPLELKEDSDRMRPYDEKILVANNTKIRTLTGWVPRTQTRAMVGRILDFWRLKMRELYGIQETATFQKKELAKKTCPTGNIDVVIIARLDDFPVVSLALNSLSTFMPCRNSVHLVLDKDAMKGVRAWAGISEPHLFLHELPLLPEIQIGTAIKGRSSGYIEQAWFMFWGDKVTDVSGGDFVMFFDSDSILANEVTCGSLFDDAGRLQQIVWPIESQNQFSPSCSQWLGGKCEWSYMTTFPFTLPRLSFAPMRAHIANKLSPGSSFDEAVATWAKKSTRAEITSLSQFVIMGNYMERVHSDWWVPIQCPMSGDMNEDSRACRDFIMPGIHLGWKSCAYVRGKNCGAQEFIKNTKQEQQAFPRFGKKFGANYVNTVQDIVNHGRCLMLNLRNETLGVECDGIDVSKPHKYSLVFMEEGLTSSNSNVRMNVDLALDRYRPSKQSSRLDKQGYCRQAVRS